MHKYITWFCMFEEIKKFINEHKRLPKLCIQEERVYRYWINKQLSNRSKLTSIQKHLLHNYDQYLLKNRWIVNYNNLKDFIAKHNRLPNINVAEERSCGIWCANQRASKKKNNLTTEQIEMLEQLDHWFWKRNILWHDTYDIVKKFIETHDRMPDRNIIEEQHYEVWCIVQKMNKSILTKKQIQLLEQLKYWTWENIN